MTKFACCCAVLLTLIMGSQPCHAARIKAYIHRFSVSIPENKEDLRVSLQTLLMSRLNGNEIQAVENQADAEIQIMGSYIVFGTVFSLDALVKTSSGTFVDRVFVQGDTQNELIPSVAEIAKRLRKAILKWNPSLAATSITEPPEPKVEKIPAAAVKKETRPAAKPATMPKPQKISEKPWVSQRFADTFNGIATGRTIAGEGTEIFITAEHYLRYYLKGKDLQFLSEVTFEPEEQLIGVDVADMDHNGTPEIYVSMLKGGLAVSQVYIPENKLLKKVKDKLPYLLRGIALEGKEKRIYAQKINADGGFSGDIYELAKSGDNFTTKNPMQLPLFANLYNFNRLVDAKGRQLFVVSHPDGYLLVYSKDKKQLWKSRDKFGGSETLICNAKVVDAASPIVSACSFSPSQRLLVTSAGEVIVSRNSGMTIYGAIRNYSINSVLKLSWNGTALQEKRLTEQSQNYLADFSYDDRTRQLMLLEVEPKQEAWGERGSRLAVITLE